MKTLITIFAMGIFASMAEAQDFDDVAHEIFKDSISMRTVVGEGNETPKFARYLADRFLSAGFAEDDVKVIDHRDTAALLVHFRGDGSSGKKPFILSSHMDVVEALREDWVKDPFLLIEENGMFYGRGVLDTKLNVAVLVATMLRLKSEGFVPSRDIILALSGDEETSMSSTQVMTKQYRDEIDAEFAIIADGGGGALEENGDAFSYTVNSAEKTYASFQVTARNPGGHSSRPRKDNAIYELAEALVKVAAHGFPTLQSDLTQAYFEKTASLVGNAELGKAMADFAKDKNDRDAVAVLRSYPEYAGVTGTTCVATLLKGGHADNALPQSASATINCRIFPDVGAAATLAELKRAAANDQLEWSGVDSVEETPGSPLRDDVFGVVERAVHAEYPGIPIVPSMSMGSTDGMHFRRAGIPAYALTGTFIKASDSFAHGLDERVPANSLPTSMRLWHRLLKDWAG